MGENQGRGESGGAATAVRWRRAQTAEEDGGGEKRGIEERRGRGLLGRGKAEKVGQN